MILLPPGNAPAPEDSDDPRTFPSDFWQQEWWPWAWQRIPQMYDDLAARDADLAGLGPSDTAVAFVKDKGWVTIWDGTAWKVIGGRRANGTVSCPSVAASGGLEQFNITFPAGQFGATPRLALSTGNTRLQLGFANLTASGFRLDASNFTSSASGTTTLHWLAEQL